MKVSETFCPLPFVHQYIAISGEKSPCCYASWHPTGKPEENPIDAFNNSRMNFIRKQMIDGKKNRHCQTCYKQEETGMHTPRQRELELWSHKSRGLIESQIEKFKNNSPLEIKTLDIRFSNTCSLKCKTCFPTNSSSIYAENLTHKEIPIKLQSLDVNTFILTNQPKNHDNKVDDMPVSSDMRWINLVGGEPLVESKNVEYLERLAKVGAQPEIIINTSFAKRNNKLLEVLKSFERVMYMVSIDGVGKYNDYIRSGSKFDEVLSHMKLVSDNQICGINSVASMYNIFHLPELIRWIKTNYPNKFNSVELAVDHPPTSIINLPPLLRLEILPELKKVYEEYPINGINNVIKVLSENNYLETGFEQFIEFTKFIDEKRGDNLLEIEPRWEPYFT